MSDGITLDYSRFEAAAESLGSIVSVDGEAFMRTQGKGVLTEVIKDTPPASDAKGGLKGKAAVEATERWIDRNLRGVFAPVQLKGTRTINHLFGDTNPSGVGRQPPYQVPAKELHPDVEGIYNARRARGQARGRKQLSRGQKAAWYVDANKLAALAAKLKGRIGWAVAGWRKAANVLKAAMPGYGKRHSGAPGDGDVEVTDRRIRVTFENAVSYISAIPGAQRILQRALDKQAGKMERQMPHVLRDAAKKAGFMAN